MNKTFAIYNFGCKVNQEEGGAIAALFSEQGWQQQQTAPKLIIINTCTVTAMADKKARNLIRRMRKEHPEAVLAVCGCYAQRATNEIAALSGIDIIAGTEERKELPQLVECYLQEQNKQLIKVAPIGENSHFSLIAPHSKQKRARAYLKIEDGCDQFCSYCIIPYVRGPIRSLPVAQAIAQAQSLLADGHQEIVLSGIHIGAYGSDLPAAENLPALIKALLALPGLARLRLGSIEPQQFDDELIALIGEREHICAHLHIPLQAGCDRTLHSMGRRYRRDDYAALLAALRSKRPNLAITTDVIVGFPGESDADFAQSVDFIASLNLAAMHVFPYSRRSGTPAATMQNQIAAAQKAERAAILSDLAKTKAEQYARQFVGKRLDLLPEEIVTMAGRRYLSGHSSNYLTLLLPWEEEVVPRKIISVYAENWLEGGLLVSQLSG